MNAKDPSDDPASVSSDGIDTAQLRGDLRARLFGDVAQPIRIGRYAVLRRLGEGGMGVVFAGYDEGLGRRVAIKLVRNERLGAEDAAMSERLRREAQALARLSHPNVVAVHEVGDHEGRVFVAMEFVVGSTLREWAIAVKRSPREILEVLRQAARGLVAVHEAGLVHRDVKPDNVMVGDDGRVRLMDFGLAHAGEESGTWTLASGSGSDSGDALVLTALTQSGACVGTPAYMAPEQFAREATDARSDQFSFCVMAWETLYGARPFAGRSLQELSTNVQGGRVQRTADVRGIPTRIRRALERGLAVAPADRHASTTDLLAAISRDPIRPVAALGVVAGAIGIAGAVTLGVRYGEQQRRDACHDPRTQLGEVWSDDTREALRAALANAGAAYAPGTADRVLAALDVYAQGWLELYAGTCEAAPSSVELHTAQIVCLDDRKRALANLVEVLSEPTAEVLERAVSATAELPRTDACNDPSYLAAEVAPPDDPAVAAQVEAVRETLRRVRALGSAGSYAEARTLAIEVTNRSREIGYAPLLAESLLELADLEHRLGEFAGSEQHLRECHSEAVASGDDRTAASASIELVYVLGERFARFDAALEWGTIADAEVRRIGVGAEHEASLANALGAVYEGKGDYQVAREHYARALEIRERVLGSESLSVAITLDNLGSVSGALGDWKGALGYFSRALALRQSALGPDHPSVGASYANLGQERVVQGQYDEATRDFESAREIFTRSLGEDHPDVAKALLGIGAVHKMKGELDLALPPVSRGVAIMEHALGPEHPDLAKAIFNLGELVDYTGDYARALSLYERARAMSDRTLGAAHPQTTLALGGIASVHQMTGELELARTEYETVVSLREQALGDEHPDVAMARGNLGTVLFDLKRYEDAIPLFEKALPVLERALEPGSPDLAVALFSLGETQRLAGHDAAALPNLERALAITEGSPLPPEQLAETKFSVARVLASTGGDRARAKALATEARDFYRDREPKRAAEIAAWLRTSPR